MAGTTNKLKVFLCHASENQPIVKALFDRLVRTGYEPWMDSQVLLPGMDSDLETRKALRASDAVIVCLSRISVAKEGRIQAEFKLAQDIQKEKPGGTIFLIPLRLDDVGIPFELQTIHWGDYTAADGFEQLVRSLNLRAGQLGKEKGQATPATAASDASSASEADTQTTQKLAEIQAGIEEIKGEIPSSRHFEFGDNPNIVERIDNHLTNIFGRLNHLRPLYESKPLKDSNPYFEAVRIVQKFRGFLQDVRNGGGSLANSSRVRGLIDELSKSIEPLLEGIQPRPSASTDVPQGTTGGPGKTYEPPKGKSPVTTSASGYEPAVFISYAWGDEREVIVDQMDVALQERGLKIIRDKRIVAYRDSIQEFMERIGRGDCVIVVISDKYLRSPNCMFELIQIAENKQFHDRIFPIVLSDADIYDPIKRIEYVKYWEEKRDALEKAMLTVGQANLKGIREDIDLYDSIRDEISELTSILKDMNTLKPEVHRDSNFRYIYDAIEQRMRKNLP